MGGAQERDSWRGVAPGSRVESRPSRKVLTGLCRRPGAVVAQRPGSHQRPSQPPAPAALGTFGLRGAALAAMAAWAAAAARLRAFGTKVPGWLPRGPWAPLAAGFCSRGLAGAERPEPGPRPTSMRQRDGIRSAAGPRAPCPPGAAVACGADPAGGGRRGGEARRGPGAAGPAARPLLNRAGGEGPGSESPVQIRGLHRSRAWAQARVGPYRTHTGGFQVGLPRTAPELPQASRATKPRCHWAQCGQLCWWPRQCCGR